MSRLTGATPEQEFKEIIKQVNQLTKKISDLKTDVSFITFCQQSSDNDVRIDLSEVVRAVDLVAVALLEAFLKIAVEYEQATREEKDDV